MCQNAIFYEGILESLKTLKIPYDFYSLSHIYPTMDGVYPFMFDEGVVTVKDNKVSVVVRGN